MKTIIAVAILTLGAGSAFAGCFGSESMYTCTDNSGNTYNVNRLGDATYVRGSNAANGTAWNQTSQRIGDTTFTRGNAANGSSWNSTTQRIGDTTFTHGTDSRGNSFRQTCNQFGCR